MRLYNFKFYNLQKSVYEFGSVISTLLHGNRGIVSQSPIIALRTIQSAQNQYCDKAQRVQRLGQQAV